jgi:hypothetical protein
MLPLAQARTQMDCIRNLCYKERAYVLDTVRRHGAELHLPSLVGAVPAFPAGCHHAICADARRIRAASRHSMRFND